MSIADIFPLFSSPKKTTLHKMTPKTPPHILFVLDYYLPHLGGLEVVFANIIQRLIKRGYIIGIVTTKHFKTLPSVEEHPQLTIWRIGKTREQFMWMSLWHLLRIAGKFDCIHTTTYAAAIPASIAGRRHRKKVILTVHELFGHLRKRLKKVHRPYRFFEWLIVQFPYTNIVAVSHYTQKQLVNAGIPQKQIALIYNGVDTTIRNPRAIKQTSIDAFKLHHQLANKTLLLYYGHSGASKGLDYLIRALPLIKQYHPDLHFLANIIPWNRDLKIQSMMHKNGSRDYTTLLHGVEQQQLLTIIGSADVVIVPSISEGFGMVAAEVSQLGKPLIVTDFWALPEVVCGKVITLHKELRPEDFLDAYTRFHLGQRTNIPQKTFSWDKTVLAYCKLYK